MSIIPPRANRDKAGWELATTLLESRNDLQKRHDDLKSAAWGLVINCEEGERCKICKHRFRALGHIKGCLVGNVRLALNNR